MSDTTEDFEHFDEDLFLNEAPYYLNTFPSQEEIDYWISFSASPDDLGKFSGKWLIFCPPSQVDIAWRLICSSMILNKLGPSAKVSTAAARDNDNSNHVICVYTKDHRNKQDVMRVREELRRLGFTQKLPYKTDCATRKGEYASTGKKVSKYYE